MSQLTGEDEERKKVFAYGGEEGRKMLVDVFTAEEQGKGKGK